MCAGGCVCAHVYIHVCIQFHLVSSWFHSFRSALPDPSGPFRSGPFLSLPDPSLAFRSLPDPPSGSSFRTLLPDPPSGPPFRTTLPDHPSGPPFRTTLPDHPSGPPFRTTLPDHPSGPPFRTTRPDHPSGPPFRTTLPDPSGPFASAHDDMHLAAHQALLAVLRDGKHTCTILSGDATQAAFRREFIVIHGGISLNIMGFYGAYWDAYQILWYIFWEGGLSENGLYQIKGRVGENPGSNHQQVPFFQSHEVNPPTNPPPRRDLGHLWDFHWADVPNSRVCWVSSSGSGTGASRKPWKHSRSGTL